MMVGFHEGLFIMGMKAESVSVKFNVGQVVHHAAQGYRGVVIDIDPRYLGRPEWLAEAHYDESVREIPWYYVLVEGRDLVTYVAEQDLAADLWPTPIDHPGVGYYFAGFAEGHYLARNVMN